MANVENNPVQADAARIPASTAHVTNIRDTLRKLDSSPSNPHSPDPRKNRQVPVDLVEEELMESFPASDPPGHNVNRGNRPEPRRPGHSA